MKAVFVYDCDGWALHRKYVRLAPYFAVLQTEGRGVFPTLAAARRGLAGSPPPLPLADVYVFLSWYWCHVYMAQGMLPSRGRVIAMVVSDYDFRLSSLKFDAVCARADLMFTQSLQCLSANPDIGFLPNPADEADWARPPRPFCRVSHRPFRLGLVANGMTHSGGDHKGVALARQIVERLAPVCELNVAGTDRLYAFHEMAGFYARIDALLILSRSEGFTPVASEALLNGVPVISTPVLPLEPFLGTSCYYPLPPRDAADADRYVRLLRGYMRQIATDPVTVRRKYLHARRRIDAWRAPRIAKRLETTILGLAALRPKAGAPL
jgi:glycosyltransferase involved in cell wall biosynthesis